MKTMTAQKLRLLLSLLSFLGTANAFLGEEIFCFRKNAYQIIDSAGQWQNKGSNMTQECIPVCVTDAILTIGCPTDYMLIEGHCIHIMFDLRLFKGRGHQRTGCNSVGGGGHVGGGVFDHPDLDPTVDALFVRSSGVMFELSRIANRIKEASGFPACSTSCFATACIPRCLHDDGSYFDDPAALCSSCIPMPDACSSNPCENAGSCTAFGAEGYSCRCPDEWYGKRCELDFATWRQALVLHGCEELVGATRCEYFWEPVP